jgi:phytoene desaturase (3,4-didehydrolycopene-forming)
LAKVGERLGVVYRLNSPVSSIILREQDQNISGIRLESGEELHADIVVINADLVYAYNNLLPPSPAASSLSKRSASCSSISFFWSFDRVIPELQTHNVFLAEEYRESFDAIFKHHSLPNEPSFYVNVPSRIDPTAAPEGKDAVVVLVPVGHLVEGSASSQHWDALVGRVRAFVFDTIEARTGAKELHGSLLHESIQTPLDWESKFNLDRGAILGLSHSFFNVLSFRPRTKHAQIEGLYFVGASTHPGTGVPVCLAGGKIVSGQIIDDWNARQRLNDRKARDRFWVIILAMGAALCCACFLQDVDSVGLGFSLR